MSYVQYLRYFLRITFIFFANVIGIPAYIIYCSLVLYPVRKYKPDFYWKQIEPRLFRWLLGMVTSWLYSGGYKVIESGDDISCILKEESLVLVNHQSTSDVPVIMSALYPKGYGNITWIMDYIFKFSNFGWVSHFHEDFFIAQGKDCRDQELIRLKEHLITSYLPTDKKWIIVFPEGGFLYKRRISSQQYAKKNNYPVLEHVTLPRIGCVKVITETLYQQSNGCRRDHERKLKWVIDITIGYPERDPLSFPGMMAGIYSPRHIHVHYRAYPINSIPQDNLQPWLYDRFTEKEKLLEHFYTSNSSMDIVDEGRRCLPRVKEHLVTVDIVELVFIHCFYLVSSYIFWILFSVVVSSCSNLILSVTS